MPHERALLKRGADIGKADLPIGADQEGQGEEHPAAGAQAQDSVAEVVRTAVGIGLAAAVGIVAARQEIIALAPGAAVRVGSADFAGLHTASDGGVAQQAASAVGVLAALHALLDERLAVRAVGLPAVGIAAAAGTESVGGADAIAAVHVLNADLTGARDRVAGRPISGAVAVQDAAHTAIARIVAAQIAATVGIPQASSAGPRGLVAHPRLAVVVGRALHAAVACAVAALATRTVLRADAAHTLPRVAPAAVAVGVGHATHADALGDIATAAWAVDVGQAGDAPTVRSATPARAAGVVAALRAPTGGSADLARALCVVATFDANAIVSAYLWSCTARIVAAVHTDLIDAYRSRRAGVVGHAALAAPLDTLRGGTAVAVDPTGNTHAVDAHAVGALGVVQAGHALAPGVALASRAVGCLPALHATPWILKTFSAVWAVRVGLTGHAGAGRKVASAAPAGGVVEAAYADALLTGADPTAQAVAVGGALDAHVSDRIADLTAGTLSAAPALHATPRSGLAHTHLAVGVDLAGHAAAFDDEAAAIRAVAVTQALGAHASGVARAVRAAVLVAAALHTTAPGGIAGADGAVGIGEALAAEARGLAARGGRAGIGGRIALGGTGASEGIAELSFGAHHTRTGRSIAAATFGGCTLAIDAGEALGTASIPVAGSAAEASVFEGQASILDAAALCVAFAGGAGR